MRSTGRFARAAAIRGVLGAAVAGLGALLWLSALGPAGAASSTAEACDAKAIVTAKIACFRDAAAAAGDPAVCQEATDGTVRFQCLSLYAERTEDAAPCARIDSGADPAETRLLRQSCVAGVAIKRGDPALCDDPAVGALRDSCLLTMVTERGADPALCGRIENGALRDACRAAGAQ